MKRMKKILAVLLAAIMVMSMGTSVFAASTTYTLTVTGNTGHTITAYQIFAGDVNDSVLSNIKWGTDVNSTAQAAILAELGTAREASDSALYGEFESITGSSTAKEVAAAIENLSEENELQALADLIYRAIKESAEGTELTESSGTYTGEGLSGGYYLVYDKPSSGNTDDSAYSYILQIVGNTSVTGKTKDAPKIEKVITSDSALGNGEANTAYFGDTVEYQITVEVPSTISQYDEYALTVYDKLEGLELATNFGEGDVTVTVYTDGQEVGSDTGTVVGTSSYSVSTSDVGENTFNVIFKNIRSLVDDANNSITVEAGYKIVVTYSATVSDTASTGTGANTNKAYATYSNDPKNKDSTGTTTEDITYTYVTSLVITKEDGEGNGVEGAKFSLYKVVATDYTYSDGDGEYVSVADGTTYYVYNTNSETMVAIESNNASTLASSEVTVYIQIDTEKEATLVSGSSPAEYKAKFTDLSAGTYMLIETNTPGGYNTKSPISFKISATTSDDDSTVNWSVSDVSSGDTVAVSDGAVTTTVVNIAGTKLPTTGGIGTTIFYIVGAVLVLGAGVVLITRRRMASR